MKESIYSKNKIRLKKYYSDLLEKIDKYEDNIDNSYKVSYTSYNEKPILQIEKNNKTWRMNSWYDESEALENWAKQFEKIPFNSVIYYFGMASVPHIEKLLSITPKEVYIILYEPSMAVFCELLKRVDMPFLENKRLGLIIKGLNEDKFILLQGICLGLDNLPHIKYLAYPNYIEIFGEDYKEYMTLIKDHVKRSMVNRNTQILFNEEVSKNYIGNIKTLYHHYSVSQLCDALPNDLPVIIISAGPSLNKNIKDLKGVRDKAFLIATDTALKPLLKENIVPHCFVTVDPGKPMFLFEDERVFDIPMVLTPSGNTDIVKRHRGKIFFSDEGHYYTNYFLDKAKKIPKALSTGGSVANNAFSLAIDSGAKSIIFVGQDLAYTNNKTHADGTFQEKMDEVDYSEQKVVEVEDIYGNMVPTSLDFKHYLEWFENEIKTNPNVKVIDATEGGAKIHGSLIMPLKEAVESECKESINIDQIIENIPQFFSKEQIKEFDEYNEDALNRLNQIYKMTKQGIKYYEKILVYFQKNNISSDEIKKIYKKIKKLDKDLEKEPLVSVLKSYMKAMEYQLLYDIGIVEDDFEDEGKIISEKGITFFKAMQEAIEYVRPFVEDMVNEKLEDE